jgi:hypothetical protein
MKKSLVEKSVRASCRGTFQRPVRLIVEPLQIAGRKRVEENLVPDDPRATIAFGIGRPAAAVSEFDVLDDAQRFAVAPLPAGIVALRPTTDFARLRRFSRRIALSTQHNLAALPHASGRNFKPLKGQPYFGDQLGASGNRMSGPAVVGRRHLSTDLSPWPSRPARPTWQTRPT